MSKIGSSVLYRNFLYSSERLIVIARSIATKQSLKEIGTSSPILKESVLESEKILRNEIATPFGFAMTAFYRGSLYIT